MKISQFYNTDYVDYGSYDNLRKIASAIDGQKNTARKILCTVLDQNIKNEVKVSQLSNKMQEHTEYLHGDASGVVVTMAQNFAGTNNMPLLDREGNFGTRFINEASAPRYIYTNGSFELWNLFSKSDKQILQKQYFEGDEIEPMFYLPNLPLLLINGSDGVSSGFAQKVLPRNPDFIRTYLKSILDGKSPNKNTVEKTFTPYFNGFKGTIEKGDTSKQWIIKGTFNIISSTTVEITELPIGYNLKSYIKVLDKLEDDKFITVYKDKSTNDIFKFQVKFLSINLKKLSNEQLLSKLKLIKTVTENYTCIDEENKIRVFDNVKDIFDYYFNIKIKYLDLRKQYLIQSITEELEFNASRYLFIKGIVEDTIKIQKRKKDVIVEDLDKIKDILRKDDSYDYLLNMPVISLTKERMEKLLQDIKVKKSELDVLKKTTLVELWKEEL